MGAARIVEVGTNPIIVMKRISGDLTISGWDRPEMQIRARHSRDNDEIGVKTLGEIIEISSHDDCIIQAPLQAQLQIEHVDGDLAVHMVLGSVTIGAVNGDAALASVGATTIGRVNGDLSARGVAGSFVVTKISGDARILQVAGAAQLGQVSGDATLSEIVGNVECEASGDIKLLINLAPNQQVSAEANGDVSCHIQTDAGAKVALEADGDIRIKNLGETRRVSHTTLAFQLGDGAAQLSLKANGDITLKGVDMARFASDFGVVMGADIEMSEEMGRRAAELSQQISAQVEVQMNAMTRELEQKLDRMGGNEEMAMRVQERVTSALRRAEEKLADAMRKMEVRTQENEVRGRRKGYGAPPPPPAPPPPKHPPTTDEERMMVLRMVEQGKISVEQAEKLLAALNGQR